MQGELFKDFFKSCNKDSCGQTLSKRPDLFFERSGFPEMKFLIGNNYEETRVNVFEYVYGPGFCEHCNTKITKLKPGWDKGWYQSCSEYCRQKMSSLRMKVDNPHNKMTPEQQKEKNKKQSETMKEGIKAGKFTPKTNNYKNQRPINFKLNGEILQVRSLWELIYRLNYPHLLYESLRIKYFDSIKQVDRIYITDFYDPSTNTIFEIRPKAYQLLLVDKQKAVIEQGYSYIIVDEDYFYKQKTPEMIELIKSVVCDTTDIEGRLKWLKKA